MVLTFHRCCVLKKAQTTIANNISSHRKYSFVKKFADVKERIKVDNKNRPSKAASNFIIRDSNYKSRYEKFALENETYEQNFNQFLSDTAFLESHNETNHSTSNNIKSLKEIPLNETSSVKTIFREFKNFSIYKYTPIDSNALKYKRVENGEMILEEGVTTKINPHKYVKSKLDQFLGTNQPGRLAHQKTAQFLRGSGQGWNPKGKKLTVMEMEEIRGSKREFDTNNNDETYANDEEKPKFDYNAVAREYGISYEGVKRILATKGHYNKSPVDLEKRLARDAKKAIEAAHYKISRNVKK